MGEVILALLPALGFGVYNFGWKALANAVVSIVGCCFFEWLYRAALKKNNTLSDLSAAVTGILVAFVCPVTDPLLDPAHRRFLRHCHRQTALRRYRQEFPEPRPGGPGLHVQLGRRDEQLGGPREQSARLGRLRRCDLPHAHGAAP